MRRHAKASSARPNQRQATGLGRILRGAFAARGASVADNGSGALSARPVAAVPSRRGLAALPALALCCLWALCVPHSVAAAPLYNVFGTGGTAGGQFAFSLFGPPNGPHGLAVNETGAGAGAEPGDVYVADRSNHRVQQFDSGGNFVRAFGLDVIVNEGAPANSNGTDYEVCDTTTSPPNTAAECKEGFPFTATGGAMNEPMSVAVDQSDGSVYVFDGANLRIQKFTSSGAFVWASGKDVMTGGVTSHEVCTVAAECTAGAEGNLGGEIGPFVGLFGVGVDRGLAVGPTGSVYFTDPLNKRVQELSPAGAFVRAFGFDVRMPAAASPASAEFEECTVAAECKGGDDGAEGLGDDGVGQFGFEAPNAIAVDPTGAVYTVETSLSPFRVQKFTPQAGPPALSPSIFAPAILSTTDEGTGPSAVAVDSSNGDVYVVKGFAEGTGTPPAERNERRVLRLDSAGTEVLDTSMAGLRVGFRESKGIAFDSVRKLAYVATSSHGAERQRVYVFGDVVPPAIVLDSVTDVAGETATARGSVDPNGGTDTSVQVEYSLDDGRKWVAVGTPVNVGNGDAEMPIELSVSGLPPNVDLLIRLVATKPFDTARVESNAIAIHTFAAPPKVQTGIAWWNGPSEFALSGTVNPSNANTDYYFQYGTSTDYGQSVPVNLKGFAGDGEVDKTVIQQVFDLQTDAAYHYRLVAVNASGTAVGKDRTIAPHNQSQVYELVSDGQSNGLGTLGLRGVSDDGKRVAIGAQTLGDPPGLPSQTNSFVAELGADRWSVPRFGPDPGEGSGGAIAYRTDFSAGLDAMLFPQRTTLESMAQEGRWQVARTDGSAEPASPQLVPLEWIGDLSDNKGAGFEMEGSSADLSTFYFKKVLDMAGLTYLPGEPLVGQGYVKTIGVNIYRSTGPDPSDLSLANIGSSGDPISNVCGAWVGSDDTLGHDLRPVSADGSVLYFSARPTAPTSGGVNSCEKATHPLRIYKRIDNTDTVEVSACAKTPPATCAEPGDDVFQGASADGEKVFFTTTRQLTDSDTDATKDLYLFDADPPAGEPAVVQVSAGEETAGHPTVGSGAGVQGVTTVSADGSRVYFVARGQLTEDAAQGFNVNNLFVYERSVEHPGGRIEFVASLLPDGFFGPSFDAGLWSEGGRPEAKAVPSQGEGDGRMLFFASRAQLLEEDGDVVTSDVYRYDDEAGELACVTCAGDGADAVSFAVGALSSPAYAQEGRFASEDGSAFVFAAREAILPEDENAAADIYLWREGGGLSLISGATGQMGSAASVQGVDAPLISPDGKRVFFMTKAALHPSDQNSALDVYAASVGGGLPLPRPEASQCEDGQSCRGDAPAPPPVSAPSSSTLSGPGNVAPPKKVCKKPKVKRKGRCVAKKHGAKKGGKAKKQRNKKHAQRANSDRGGKR